MKVLATRNWAIRVRVIISIKIMITYHVRPLATVVIAPSCGAFDLGLAVSVPLPIVMGIFVLLWFQSHLT